MAEGGKQPQLAESTGSSSSLTCGICLEQYKEPKILPCSHTFCLACLQKTLSMKEERAAKALESSRTASKQEPDGETVDQEETYDFTESLRPVETQKISCPICKREHTVPLEGLTQFQADFEAIQTIEMELLQKSLTKSKVSQKCGSCSKERPITNHCDECGGICQKCTEMHEEMVKIFAEHTVVPIKEVTADSVGLKKKAHPCSRHGEKVTMYCDRCSQVICHICIVEKHQSHRVSLLEDADKKLQKKVDQQSKDVQEIQRTFEKYCAYIARVDGEMAGESYMKKLRKKVSAEFDERIRRLQEKRESLVQSIDNYDSQSKKQVWSEKNTIELVLNKIKAGLRMTQKAQRLVNPADRIAMNSEGTKILAEVGKAAWSHKSLPRPLVLKRSSDSSSQLLMSSDLPPSCEDLHVVPISENDISVSVVDENGSKVRTPKLGQPTIVEVTFSVGMVEEPMFQVLYGKSHQILESVASYETTESKCWNIEFVPRCAGKHPVQIWLGGVAIAVKDDITINGKLSIGSKVRPGPDWVAPDDTMLYLNGTVVNTSLTCVEVDWSQDAGAVEERTILPVDRSEEAEVNKIKEEADPLLLEAVEDEHMDMETPLNAYPGINVGGFLGQQVKPEPIPTMDAFDTEEIGETTVGGDSTESILTKEPTTNNLVVIDSEDEPRPKFVRRTHEWGGFLSSGTYEVELVL